MTQWILKILETPEEMAAVEELQRLVWPGNETEIVPAHMLLAVAHNGGLVVGAYTSDSGEDPEGELPELTSLAGPAELPASRLIGFVFGFPGLYTTPDGPRSKHCSHMLGVRPDIRDRGIGFSLKRAQWQMIRHQGVDRITWTYDPLLSRNAYLNITKLGAVCNTYRRNEYGELRDEMNTGLSSDRFQVDWWVNTRRVERRLGRRRRLQLDLAHFLAAGAEIINPSQDGAGKWPRPAATRLPNYVTEAQSGAEVPLLLLEIPADFLGLKTEDLQLAVDWRYHSRELFEELFALGYLVTDFIYLSGTLGRSFYVLSHGESTF